MHGHGHTPGRIISIFLAKRFATFVATLIAASVLIFAALGILPGNAAEVRLGESASPEAVKALSAMCTGWRACCAAIWA